MHWNYSSIKKHQTNLRGFRMIESEFVQSGANHVAHLPLTHWVWRLAQSWQCPASLLSHQSSSAECHLTGDHHINKASLLNSFISQQNVGTVSDSMLHFEVTVLSATVSTSHNKLNCLQHSLDFLSTSVRTNFTNKSSFPNSLPCSFT